MRNGRPPRPTRVRDVERRVQVVEVDEQRWSTAAAVTTRPAPHEETTKSNIRLISFARIQLARASASRRPGASMPTAARRYCLSPTTLEYVSCNPRRRKRRGRTPCSRQISATAPPRPPRIVCLLDCDAGRRFRSAAAMTASVSSGFSVCMLSTRHRDARARELIGGRDRLGNDAAGADERRSLPSLQHACRARTRRMRRVVIEACRPRAQPQIGRTRRAQPVHRPRATLSMRFPGADDHHVRQRAHDAESSVAWCDMPSCP